MGTNKRYFWLKLKNDFFTQREIKKLRTIAGGDTFTIIYLKLQLLSLKNEGKLEFEGVEETFIEEMALELDEGIENVTMTIGYLQKHGLIEEIAHNEFLLPKAIESMGSETQVADRVRRFREKKKALHCNTLVTIGNTEIELEKELEIDKEIDIKPVENKKPKKNVSVKIKYADRVTLTEIEYSKLLEKYSKSIVDNKITDLDLWKGSKGKNTKSDYYTLLTWLRKDKPIIENNKVEHQF